MPSPYVDLYAFATWLEAWLACRSERRPVCRLP